MQVIFHGEVIRYTKSNLPIQELLHLYVTYKDVVKGAPLDILSKTSLMLRQIVKEFVRFYTCTMVRILHIDKLRAPFVSKFEHLGFSKF